MDYLARILENIRSGDVSVEKARHQIINLLGAGDTFNEKQIFRIQIMLDEISKESYIAAGGTELNWVEFYKKRNKINLN